MRLKTFVLGSTLTAAAFIAAMSPDTVRAQAAGKISGRILLKGEPSLPIKIKMTEPRCMQANPNGAERRQIDGKNGGLANVVVAIKGPIKGTPPKTTTPALLDQVGCMYSPVVLAVQTGQPVKIRNSDETLHNVHPRPVTNAPFNLAQPRKGMESERTFDKPETIFPVSCDVHPWMRSYIAVFDHPYFTVTKDDGTFEIPNVPPGEYEVEATHPTLKSMTGKVVVKAGAPATLELTFVSK